MDRVVLKSGNLDVDAELIRCLIALFPDAVVEVILKGKDKDISIIYNEQENEKIEQ